MYFQDTSTAMGVSSVESSTSHRLSPSSAT